MPVRSAADIRRVLEAPTPCVEYRLDYAERVDEQMMQALREAVEKKVAIFTVRRREEGGAWRGTEEERIRLYASLLDLRPHYIDIEVESPAARELSPSGGTKVIASRHDFEQTPPLEVLMQWGRKAAEVGDVVKVVTYARSPADGLRVLSLIGALEKPTVAFAMGPHGVYTRLAAAVLGSPIMYVSLGEATAPGQTTPDAYYAGLLAIGLAPQGQDLPTLREALDWVDGALMYLLKRRLEICRDIGRIKKVAGLPIYDDEREARVLKRAGDFKQLFEILIQMCKAVQIVA